jgi:hypothetical protein
MTTVTRRLATAAAATVLGAGFSLMAAGAPAHAAPATGPSPVTACQGIGGTFGEYGGTWYCQYSGTYGADPQVLVDWCSSQEYSSTLIDDGTITLSYSFACAP